MKQMSCVSMAAAAMLTIHILLLVPSGSQASSVFRCDDCPGGECPDPTNCRYGITLDHCNKKVCAKGPGERCGGAFKMLGDCGDGMSCRCGRCSGCSLDTFECYDHTCL